MVKDVDLISRRVLLGVGMTGLGKSPSVYLISRRILLGG